jgi:hypothetical protein
MLCWQKWTGSTALGARFRDSILSNPKSFTRKDLSYLRRAHEKLLSTTQSAAPLIEGEPDAPVSDRPRSPPPAEPEASPTLVRDFAPGAVNTTDTNRAFSHYWNEYEDGSEAGDFEADGGYVIYINGEEKSRGLPGMSTLSIFFEEPVQKLRGWFGVSEKGKSRDFDPLLTNGHVGGYGTTNGGGRFLPSSQDSSDHEADDASSDEFPTGYSGYYAALPSINDQRAMRQRERMLFIGTVASFALSLVLLGVSFILIQAGRRKLRAEVDAGVTIGVVVSLGLDCVGLVMALSRNDLLGWANSLATWVVFVGLCVLNGMILVLVAGNTAP